MNTEQDVIAPDSNAPASRAGPFSLLAPLDDTRRPFGRYFLRAWLSALVPALAVSQLVTPLLGVRKFRGSPEELFLNAVLVAPLLETALMVVLFAGLRIFTRRRGWLLFLSGLFWACLHAMVAPAAGFIVFWPFVVFSQVFLAWEKRSRTRAFAVTATLHSAYNLLPALLLAAG